MFVFILQYCVEILFWSHYKLSDSRDIDSVPLSDAREEKPLVVEMLSSSCCERLSLISLTKEKPVEKGPGAEEVEG